MTELLLQKLEERMMLLLAEIEGLRKEVVGLRKDNSYLRTEKETNTRKLSDLLSLLDSVSAVDHAVEVAKAVNASVQPVSISSVAYSERREQEYA